MKNRLYGDGVNDDRPAIQELLDSGASRVALPEPEKFYRIGAALALPSNIEFALGRFTQIKLMPDSNCLMLKNADYAGGNSNICIEGGIWDMDHTKQWPNPLHFPNPEGKKYMDHVQETGYDPKTADVLPDIYFGTAIRFCRVKNFSMKNMTLKNPVTFGVQAAHMEYFTFENITFDYTEGSPRLLNMDGIHLEGHCRNGVLRNLQGPCHDDLVALTADDSLFGPIENVLIDGIYASGSHSAVRLLSHLNTIKNVRITNVFGSFYTYCVGITNYSASMAPEDRGYYENIALDNIFANVSKGTTDVGSGNFSPVHIDYNLDIRNLKISGLHRDEKNHSNPTIYIGPGTRIGHMILSDVRQTNATGRPMPLIENNGAIEKLVLESVDTGGEELEKTR